METVARFWAMLVVGIAILSVAMIPFVFLYGFGLYALSLFVFIGASCATIEFSSFLLASILNAMLFVWVYRLIF